MERFQKLRESGYAVTFSQTYLEQGRYAEAIASTGAEAGLVTRGRAGRAVHRRLAGHRRHSRTPADGRRQLTLADLDGDGDLDLLEADALRAAAVSQRRTGRFTPMTLDAARMGRRAAVVAGDSTTTAMRTCSCCGRSACPLLRQDAGGGFTDVTAARRAWRGRRPALRSAAWLDADHDGDLDLSRWRPRAATRLFRNNGKAVFADITAAAGLGDRAAIAALVPTDYDNRRDIDLLLVRRRRRPLLYRNMRDGTFKDVAGEVGLAVDGAGGMAAAGDVNKDGYVDFFFARAAAPGLLALSDGRGRFAVSTADASRPPARQRAQFVDYDNDGLLDLVATDAGRHSACSGISAAAGWT